jgi:hypothetical protein
MFAAANFDFADLRDADLRGAALTEARFIQIKLSGADLSGADLGGADLIWADLIEVKFIKANLTHTNFHGADVCGADLSSASCCFSVFTDVDLSVVKGLDSVSHKGPSSVGIDTLVRSKGKIPESFLRGCGVPDALIKELPKLIDSIPRNQFYSSFITYSAKDTSFAERLLADLRGKGVRCWFAPGDC